jgi:hypothetical protein
MERAVDEFSSQYGPVSSWTPRGRMSVYVQGDFTVTGPPLRVGDSVRTPMGHYERGVIVFDARGHVGRVSLYAN